MDGPISRIEHAAVFVAFFIILGLAIHTVLEFFHIEDTLQRATIHGLVMGPVLVVFHRRYLREPS